MKPMLGRSKEHSFFFSLCLLPPHGKRLISQGGKTHLEKKYSKPTSLSIHYRWLSQCPECRHIPPHHQHGGLVVIRLLSESSGVKVSAKLRVNLHGVEPQRQCWRQLGLARCGNTQQTVWVRRPWRPARDTPSDVYSRRWRTVDSCECTYVHIEDRGRH